ncbi:MAG: hypothetical protein V4692_01530 [Bdellovibrionota bacterium]
MLKAIKSSLKTLLAVAFLVPSFSLSSALAQGEEAELGKSRCSARAIERFYCPTYGDQWWGPYWDNGCRVKCDDGEKAVCMEAGCTDDRSGDSYPSSCECI